MAEKQNIPGFRPELLEELYVQHLHSVIYSISARLSAQEKKIAELEAEIRRLKKLPKKPDIKPSKLDENPKEPSNTEAESKEAQGGKRKKKETLEIHDHQEISLVDVPADWEFAGYESRIIQDFIVRANNIEYRLEIWKSPDGLDRQVACLPEHLQNTHFGPVLKAYILHQYYECGVTQPLILSGLRDHGVDISSGQISAILIENKEIFHQEKESLLAKGIELSEELRTDDTGARHTFKNAFCNCINSSLFTYFTTTFSKSRINFLEILRVGRTDYYLNETAFAYLQKEELPPKYYQLLEQSYNEGLRLFEDKAALEAYFSKHAIEAKYAVKQITEALLMGCLVEHGFDPNMVIHSDGAGQFNLFIHALCWKHAERPLVKLKCYNPFQQSQWEEKMTAFWSLYQALKQYKIEPAPQKADQLDQQFDQLCEGVDNFAALNQVLEDLKAKKERLLVVLQRPNTSLHNNDSERDIREFVKRRKISGSTRSENGRKARDTFLSLKKTCRKLGVSFWDYLLDRLKNANDIPPLAQVMAQKAVLSKA
jgi:hypothetical protein